MYFYRKTDGNKKRCQYIISFRNLVKIYVKILVDFPKVFLTAVQYVALKYILILFYFRKKSGH